MGNLGKGWAIGSGISTLAVELLMGCLALALTWDLDRTLAQPPPPALSQMKMFSRDKPFLQWSPSFTTTPGAHSQRESHFCLSPNPNSHKLYPEKWRHVILGLASCQTVLLNTKRGFQNSMHKHEARFIFGWPWNSESTVLSLLITEALLLVICWSCFCKQTPGYWKH